MNSPDIVIVGSLAVDSICTPRTEHNDLIGGSAVYAGIAAGKFSSVGIIGTVGSDDKGREIIEHLNANKIDTRGIQTETGRTFSWKGRYLDDMNQRETTFLDLGVFAGFSFSSPGVYKSPKVVFLANISPGTQQDILDSLNPGFAVLDTMDHWILNDRERVLSLLPRIDMLIINDSESLMISGERLIFNAGRKLLALGAKNVLIKKGEHGSLLFSGEDIFMFPAYPLDNPRDPTGAGDSFAGAFIGYLNSMGLDKKHTRRAVVFATVVASFCVEEFGTKGLCAAGEEQIRNRVEELLSFTRV